MWDTTIVVFSIVKSHSHNPNPLQQFSCRQTTVGTLHATFLEGFGYSDVVHQFENAVRANSQKAPTVENLIRR
jgi:hypothetical protein